MKNEQISVKRKKIWERTGFWVTLGIIVFVTIFPKIAAEILVGILTLLNLFGALLDNFLR